MERLISPTAQQLLCARISGVVRMQPSCCAVKNIVKKINGIFMVMSSEICGWGIGFASCINENSVSIYLETLFSFIQDAKPIPHPHISPDITIKIPFIFFTIFLLHNSWVPSAQQLMGVCTTPDMRAHNSCCAVGDINLFKDRHYIFRQLLLYLPTTSIISFSTSS